SPAASISRSVVPALMRARTASSTTRISAMLVRPRKPVWRQAGHPTGACTRDTAGALAWPENAACTRSSSRPVAGAGLAQAAQSQRSREAGGQEVVFNAHVEQARDGGGGAVGMHG